MLITDYGQAFDNTVWAYSLFYATQYLNREFEFHGDIFPVCALLSVAMRKGRPVSWMALSGCCSVIPSVEKRYRPVPAAAQRV